MGTGTKPGMRQMTTCRNIVLVVLLGLGLCDERTSAVLARERAISYANAARTWREVFVEKHVTSVAVMPKQPLPAQEENPFFGETRTRPAHDCSTAEVRCTSYWSRVFAVPRGRLSPSASYAAAGATLTVESCLRGDDKVCQVALIRADCQRIAGKDGCEQVVGGREKSDEPGPLTYFIFNEDVGITAWGVAREPAKTRDDQLRIAYQMVLQGDRGLLFAGRVAHAETRGILFESPSHTGTERFKDDEVTAKVIIPKRLLPDQASNTMLAEGIGSPSHDCSNTQYRCLYYWARVFAVPRSSRLSPASKYSVAGAVLKVEDCIRGDNAVCQVALISADCHQISGKDGCEEVVGGREKSTQPGPVTYFIFNEDIGITAWGVAQEPAQTTDEQLAIATQTVLKGDRGLFAPGP
jgi:hypothetical protein